MAVSFALNILARIFTFLYILEHSGRFNQAFVQVSSVDKDHQLYQEVRL
jgi:ABC-type spermidine/putrescine transport system permease subunit I